MNESYADMMGIIADRELGDNNWLFMENATGGGGPISDFQNLPMDRLSKYVPLSEDNDNGGVHSYSGIANRAGYFMIAGGAINGVRVLPMSQDKVRMLKWEALRNLPESAGFQSARAFEVATAIAWARDGTHGFNQQDVCTVRNGWAAVEVGWGDADCNGIEDRPSDLDGDYWPDLIDICPLAANPAQDDTDRDGVGDACDNCPSRPNPIRPGQNRQDDLDGDGQGDACDDDVDGDGCPNSRDQHPTSASARTGTLTTTGCCAGGSSAVFTSEAGYSDDDPMPDCEDLDDDNDGIPDDGFDGIPGTADDDPCPTISRYLPHLSCSTTVDCPCAPKADWWNTCIVCGDVFARIRHVTSPDPTLDVLVDNVQIVNRSLYLAPSTGNTVPQMANAILFRPTGFAPAAQAGPDLRRIELWARPTATVPPRLLAVVGEFDLSDVQTGQLAAGSQLALTPMADNSLTIEAVWNAGANPGSATQDSDGDGLPDGWEVRHSLSPRNPADASIDTDGDGVSNLEEFKAGSSPTDAQSVFRMTQVRRQASGLQIEFRAVPGRQYQMEQAPALGQGLPWQAVGEPIRAMGGSVVHVISSSEASAYHFYRVRLVPE